MNRQLIWKEWRDHRAALLALWAGIPVVLLAFLWTSGSYLLYTGDSHRVVGILGMASVLVLVGFSTFSGEWRREHGAFLARLPGGLTRSFTIKMAFLLCMLIATGFWATEWTNLLFGGPEWRGPDVWIPERTALVVVLVPTFVCILAVSASVMQPGFALVGGPVLAGLLTFPFWQAIQQELLTYSQQSADMKAGLAPIFPIAGIPPMVQAGIGIASCFLGASLAIWIAYTRHKSLPGNRASLFAIGALFAGCTPVWASWSFGQWQVHSVSPGSEYFAINNAYVGQSGEYAFLNTKTRFFDSYYTGQRPIKVNLVSGEWEIIGDLGTQLSSPQSGAKRRNFRESFPYSNTVTRVDTVGTSKVRHWSTATGTVVDEPVPRVHPWPEPDLDAPEAAKGWDLRHYEGLGSMVYADEDHGAYWDPTRQRKFRLPQETTFNAVLVLPGPWLLQVQSSQGEPEDWFRFDPKEQTLKKDPYLKPGDHRGNSFTDGHTLFAIDNQCAIYDPRENTPPALLVGVGEVPAEVDWVNAMSRFMPRAIDSTDPIFLRTGFYDRGHAGWLDLDNMAVHWREVSPSKDRIVGSTQPGCATFIHDHSQLIRINFVTGERTVLFPKGEELKP